MNSDMPALGQCIFLNFMYIFFNFIDKFKNCCLNFHLADLIELLIEIIIFVHHFLLVNMTSVSAVALNRASIGTFTLV